jgi:hypothetical protein
LVLGLLWSFGYCFLGCGLFGRRSFSRIGLWGGNRLFSDGGLCGNGFLSRGFGWSHVHGNSGLA